MRRIAYFTTLFLTFVLALLPWLESLPFLSSSGQSSIVLDEGKCIGSAFCFLAGIPKLIGAFLPAFASTWVETFSANPGIFGGLASAVVGLMIFSMWLDKKIHDRMTIIWQPATALPTSFSRLHDFRESKAYQWTLRTFKKHILPAIFGLAALAGIVIIVVSGASRTIFSYADAKGFLCELSQSAATKKITGNYSDGLNFEPSKPCWASGLIAEKGATYRVVLNIAGQPEQWTDGRGKQADGSGEIALKADLQGNIDSRGLLIRMSAWPAKRYIWEEYYKPIARIRTLEQEVTGQDEYVLNPTFKSSRPRYDCLVSDFTAQSPGELFFFVNDAIIYFWPNLVMPTYDNNRGSAEVFVKRIVAAGEPFVIPLEMQNKSACEEFVSNRP